MMDQVSYQVIGMGWSGGGGSEEADLAWIMKLI